jgi:integrase
MAILTSDEVLDFLEAIEGSPYRTLFYVGLFTGLRRSELLGLQWGDLNLDLASLSVVRTLHQRDNGQYIIRPPKTKKSKRVVDLSPSVALLLRQHRREQEAQRALLGKSLREDDWVFAYPDGSPLRPGTVSHAFSKLSHKGVIPKIRLHDLRHSHATLLLEDGMDINAVKQRLGHSSAAFTLDTYGHVTPRMQRAVVDSLDRLVGRDGGKMVAKWWQNAAGQI